jgi:hypothetical protein
LQSRLDNLVNWLKSFPLEGLKPLHPYPIKDREYIYIVFFFQ